MKLSVSACCRALFISGLILVALVELASPAGSPTAPSQQLISSFYFRGGWCAGIFLLIALPAKERVRLLAAALVCAAIGLAIGALCGGPAGHVAHAAMAGASAAPYLFCLARIGLSSGAERSRWIDVFCVASLTYAVGLVLPFFLGETARWFPAIVDSRIAAFDEAFGIQLSGVMANLLAATPWLHNLCLTAYLIVPVPIIVVAACEWRRGGEDRFSIIPAFLAATAIGFGCYLLMPAIGPREYFGADFPLLHATPDFLAHQPLLNFAPVPRNAMPSLHMTWAMQAFLYLRGFPRWARAYAAFLAILTAAATLGFGEHYAMDLIVAAPLILLTRSLCETRLEWAEPARMRGLVAGAAMLAFWIYAIRGGEAFAPAAVVLLSALTLGASVALEIALARAAEPARRPASAGATSAAPIALDIPR